MKLYDTSDLALAAFLLMQGISLLSAKKDASGKFKFTFDDSDVRVQDLAVQFVNSDFSKFDNHVRNLRKLMYS
tara:strand:- start:322 stop:540 length:219 start_codon:yes stop_codon:yes gene_type:complete